jgi:hypothetical protein
MIVLTARCLEPARCPFADARFCENPGCAVESDEVKPPCSVTDHEKRLRRLSCVVSDRTPITLHHTRGGSVARSAFGGPGAGQKQNPALQIPLHADYHVGRWGIDAQVGGGVQRWELRFGEQTDHLSSTSHLVRYSLWTLAWSWASELTRRRVGFFLREHRSRCLPP